MGRRARSEAIAAYLFLGPWFAGLILITVGPLVASLVLSFTDYDMTGTPGWVGLRNYAELLFHDPRFWRAARVTFVYVVVSVPLVIAVSLLIAVTLDRGLSGLPIYRTMFYIPSLIGGSVTIALLWRQVFGSEGVFNAVLEPLGLSSGGSWIGHPNSALGTLITLHVWSFGSTMVIFLAALRQVPLELYEAARVDGSNAWQRFWRISLPLITPAMLFNLVLQTISSFQAFTQAHIVSNGSGGPIDSTLFYTLYLYQKAFIENEMGYASAMAWLLLVAIAGFTAALFATSRFWVFYGDR